MALTRCKRCGTEIAVGWMPTASCGMLLIPPLAWAIMLPFVLWDRIGWWSLTLPVPTFFVVAIAIHFVPYTIEYALAFRRRCPNCGARRWSYPFTRGFGL